MSFQAGDVVWIAEDQTLPEYPVNLVFPDNSVREYELVAMTRKSMVDAGWRKVVPLSPDADLVKVAEYLRDNIALYDCQGDCPDEIALDEDKRTPEYCNRCFAKTLLRLIREG